MRSLVVAARLFLSIKKLPQQGTSPLLRRCDVHLLRELVFLKVKLFCFVYVCYIYFRVESNLEFTLIILIIYIYLNYYRVSFYLTKLLGQGYVSPARKVCSMVISR